MKDCRRPASSGGGAGSWRLAGALVILGLCGGTQGCRVPSPKPEQLLSYGFGSPGQAFRSFATAVQGELLDPLYDSLSNSFKSFETGAGLSRNGFKEAWDGLIQEEPLLRWALYQATKDPSQVSIVRAPDGHKAKAQALVAGRLLEVYLVREGFWEIYAEDEDATQDPVRLADRSVPKLEGATPGGLGADETRTFIYVPTPADGIGRLAHIKGGYEWKVSGFNVIEQ
ncbi:MAG: hypothetical protein ACI8QC_003545 [Planctomycetota bacterium]|jgi:hypothetical protein